MTAPPPPPLPYQGGQPGWYPPPPPPRRKNTKWWVLGGIVLALVMIIGTGAVIFMVVTSEGNVTATDLEVGECLAEIPQGDNVTRLQTVGCDQPHAGEVFALLTVPGGDFPGTEAIDTYAEKCAPELAVYAPTSTTDDGVQLYVLYPSAETWEDGDRAVTCIATLDPPRTGSLKG
ncbi:septum formation family protein [Mycolicibacterium hippocampi]|uniref:septum formation family protein n=1 Tax=Mycolicibacterium hippocampi TaxID=659824 RepID=UPI001F323C99|nr:septum formation family protein [Mycolicibacterium hippocampi]